MSESTVERVPEERVATILARAAELDRNARETVDLEAIRAAAVEAGISPAAVDRALAEYAAGEIRPRGESRERERPDEGGRIRRWLRKFARPVTYGVVAFVTGAFLGAVGDGGEPLILLGFVGYLAAAVRLVLKDRPKRRVLRYLATTVAMSGAALLSYGGIEGDEDVAAAFFMCALAAIILGSLAVRFWKRGEQRESEPVQLHAPPVQLHARSRPTT